MKESVLIHDVKKGTASIFFCFKNAYLELLWVQDLEELKQADPTMAKKIKVGGSPFGLGLRRVDSTRDDLPFPTHPYFAEWMRPGTTMEIAYSSELNEPDIFVVPPYMEWDEFMKSRPQILDYVDHDLGLQELTGIRFSGPDLPTDSKAIAVLQEQNLVEFKPGLSFFVELIFDQGRSEKTLSLQPRLPVKIHY